MFTSWNYAQPFQGHYFMFLAININYKSSSFYNFLYSQFNHFLVLKLCFQILQILSKYIKFHMYTKEGKTILLSNINIWDLQM